MLLPFVALLLAVAAAFMLNICIGDVWLNPQQALACLSSHTGPAGDISQIIWQIRLPRLLIAAVVGSALSVSGYVLQALSRNQLADPYLTGVSSGAGLAVAVATIASLDFNLVPVCAFLGGLLAASIVAALSRSPSGLSVTRLLLCGVGLSAICSGFITMLLTSFASSAQAQGLFFWLAGGIAGRTWSELYPAAGYTTFGIIAIMLMGKQIRLLGLGTRPAQALGLDVSRIQWMLLTASVLLCGAAVSVSGLVGFVGLIAPHIARRLFSRNEHVQIICTALCGMVMVMISDLAARTLGQGQELPLGTLLSVMGGPFFLILVAKQKGESL